MFKKLFVSATSACFELKNKNPYYSPEKYSVILNGVKQSDVRDTNVFSLFGLNPDTEYTVETTLGGKIVFTTLPETAVVDAKALGAKGDGKSDDTYYVQMAIDSCPEGGRVLLTDGIYSVRPLVLKSGITIELEKDAVLLGDIKEENYPFVPARKLRGGKEEIIASWEGEPFEIGRASCRERV